ncbi:MAG: CsiV family protein [Pseudomonadota bacterium]
MKKDIVNKLGRDAQARLVCLVCFGMGVNISSAQELSYDGKRWVEVELSIFTSEYPVGEFSEQPVAKNLSLQYLPKLQKLLTPVSSLMIDFPEPVALPPLVPSDPANTAAQINEPSLIEMPPQIGPVYSPALKNGFKVSDYARDAYIALADRLARFNSINRSLADSPEHEILWHQVWRQPMQARAQTPAIFVVGGESAGTHAELEGSFRLSDISGRPTLDVNVWLNNFSNSADTSESEWNVPDLPLPLAETQDLPIVPLEPVAITEVWQQQQTKDLGANEIYYLDHPALGILIQIRPYLLPEQPVLADEGDF